MRRIPIFPPLQTGDVEERNQRVATLLGSTNTEFVFNAAGQRVSTCNGSTNAQIRGQYYWGAKPVVYYDARATHFPLCSHSNRQSRTRWSYDAFGNRTGELEMNTGAASSQTASPCPSLSSSNATHWSSYATSNRVNGSDTLISYDGAGNVTAAGNYEYLYDAEGRQCAVANLLTSSVTQYVYDAEGRRVASFPWPSGGQMPSAGSTCPAPASFGGLPVTTAFLHDWVGGLEATLTRVSSISGWNQDVMANGQLVASYSWQGMPPPGPPIAPTLTFHLNDWLGTKRLDINQSGQAVSWWSSDPFGNYLTAHGAGTDPSARHFTGQERDGECQEGRRPTCLPMRRARVRVGRSRGRIQFLRGWGTTA